MCARERAGSSGDTLIFHVNEIGEHAQTARPHAHVNEIRERVQTARQLLPRTVVALSVGISD